MLITADSLLGKVAWHQLPVTVGRRRRAPHPSESIGVASAERIGTFVKFECAVPSLIRITLLLQRSLLLIQAIGDFVLFLIVIIIKVVGSLLLRQQASSLLPFCEPRQARRLAAFSRLLNRRPRQ